MSEFPDDKIKHLEMIQRVVDRIAGESARMKQFCLVSIAALASTATATNSWGLALVAALLTLVFWGLDAKYLSQERAYRALYERVRSSADAVNFVMAPDETIRTRHTLYAAITGWSVAILYGALVAINIGICISVALNAVRCPNI